MAFFLLAKAISFDVIKVVIGVGVLLFAILKQVFEANKQAGKKAAAAGSRAQGNPKPVPTPGGQQADPLRSQVEEFLRRAGQKNQGGQPASGQRPASEIELLVDDDAQQQRRPLVESNRPNTPRKASAPVSDKRVPRRSVTPKRRVTLAERAAAREEVRVSNLAEQPAHLGQRIIEDDKQFDQQLRAKFDHTVGTLGGTPMMTDPQPTAPERPSPAAQIAAMLTNPEGVRQAVLLNEIMNRPSDRW